MKKQGEGFMDVIKNPISTIKEALQPIPTRYANISRRTLESFGDQKIKGLRVARTPLNKGLEKIINVLSLNKFSKLKQQNNTKILYHVGLIAILESNQNIIIEKNEVVTIEPLQNSKSIKSNTEYYNIDVLKDITLNQLMDNTMRYMGDNAFFGYNGLSTPEAKQNNCQDFTKSILTCNGLYNDNIKNFMYQDLNNISNGLNNSGYSYVTKTMKKITDFGSIASRLMGKGNYDKALKHFKNNMHKYTHHNIENKFLDYINTEGLQFL